MATTFLSKFAILFLLSGKSVHAFQSPALSSINPTITRSTRTSTSTRTSKNTQYHPFITSLNSNTNDDSNSKSNTNKDKDIVDQVTSRFPTSPEDQVRQASISLIEANKDGKTRHSIRLLLPIIGATELDDWPGGARQMMEAASPLIQDVMKIVNNGINNDSSSTDSSSTGSSSTGNGSTNAIFNVQESVIDQSDGVRALFSQGQDPKNDACAILLPSADTIPTIQKLNDDVGMKRNLVLVNTQWRRKTDFGNGGGGVGGLSFFGGGGGNAKKEEKIEFVEGFEPTFHCSNVMVEGDIIRVLRTYPGPWRVYLREVDAEDETKIDWIEIGTKDVLERKTAQWESDVKEAGDYDGGKLFDYGTPSYKEIETMIVSREGYMPKSLSERAAAAFTFIKDTL